MQPASPRQRLFDKHTYLLCSKPVAGPAPEELFGLMEEAFVLHKYFGLSRSETKLVAKWVQFGHYTVKYGRSSDVALGINT
jgi:hypothetical protein